jgi:hypothetical protein
VRPDHDAGAAVQVGQPAQTGEDRGARGEYLEDAVRTLHGFAGGIGEDWRESRGAKGAGVDAEDDVRVEQGEELVEATLAGGRQKGRDDPPLDGEIGVRVGIARVDPMAGPTRQLTSGRG